MTLEDIYNDYTPGSTGFVIAVETHCGFEISREETVRIASKAETPEQFAAIWENEDWWTDENNQ
jgi:molybdopterin biosynthesis enzyme